MLILKTSWCCDWSDVTCRHVFLWYGLEWCYCCVSANSMATPKQVYGNILFSCIITIIFTHTMSWWHLDIPSLVNIKCFIPTINKLFCVFQISLFVGLCRLLQLDAGHSEAVNNLAESAVKLFMNVVQTYPQQNMVFDIPWRVSHISNFILRSFLGVVYNNNL